MINLFADLDNTLVYSHRVTLPGDRVAVEWLNDRVQSCMTRRTYDFLAKGGGFRLIPTTARGQEQYARLIPILSRLRCRYALICNGGVLLRDGVEDRRWSAETRARIVDELPAFREAVAWFHREAPEERVRQMEDFLVYAPMDDLERAAARLSQALGGAGVNICHDRRKLYCTPASVNKGAALRRLAEREGFGWCAAAGDSLFDVPMLEEADLAMLPEALSSMVRAKRKRVWAGEGCFSDFICQVMAGLLENMDKNQGGRL